MSDEVERRNNGQFAAGQSGNAAGARSRKRPQLITTEDFYRTILEVAGSTTRMTLRGKPYVTTMLESNVWGLASGKPPNRLASKDFLELTKSATYFMAAQERERKRRDFGY